MSPPSPPFAFEVNVVQSEATMQTCRNISFLSLSMSLFIVVPWFIVVPGKKQSGGACSREFLENRTSNRSGQKSFRANSLLVNALIHRYRPMTDNRPRVIRPLSPKCVGSFGQRPNHGAAGCKIFSSSFHSDYAPSNPRSHITAGRACFLTRKRTLSMPSQGLQDGIHEHYIAILKGEIAYNPMPISFGHYQMCQFGR